MGEIYVILFSLLLALVCTILFDFIVFKIDCEREMEDSWKSLNERLESEGKTRWDKK